MIWNNDHNAFPSACVEIQIYAEKYEEVIEATKSRSRKLRRSMYRIRKGKVSVATVTASNPRHNRWVGVRVCSLALQPGCADTVQQVQSRVHASCAWRSAQAAASLHGGGWVKQVARTIHRVSTDTGRVRQLKVGAVFGFAPLWPKQTKHTDNTETCIVWCAPKGHSKWKYAENCVPKKNITFQIQGATRCGFKQQNLDIGNCWSWGQRGWVLLILATFREFLLYHRWTWNAISNRVMSSLFTQDIRGFSMWPGRFRGHRKHQGSIHGEGARGQALFRFQIIAPQIRTLNFRILIAWPKPPLVIHARSIWQFQQFVWVEIATLNSVPRSAESTNDASVSQEQHFIPRHAVVVTTETRFTKCTKSRSVTHRSVLKFIRIPFAHQFFRQQQVQARVHCHCTRVHVWWRRQNMTCTGTWGHDLNGHSASTLRRRPARYLSPSRQTESVPYRLITTTPTDAQKFNPASHDLTASVAPFDESLTSATKSRLHQISQRDSNHYCFVSFLFYRVKFHVSYSVSTL